MNGYCDSWDCNMQTVDDVKKEAVNEYIKAVVKELDIARTYNDGLISEVIPFYTVVEILKQGGVADDVLEPIKVTSLEVIVTGSKRKPYFEIKYKKVGTEKYNIGFSSYNLNLVLDWKEKCFELVKVVD